MTRDELDGLWRLNPTLRAFCKALRMGEGTDQGDDGYRTMFGGFRFVGPDGVANTFDDFADHPRKAVSLKLRKGGLLTSTAAGAYQFLERTWDELVEKYGFEDFSPHNQDLACVALIIRRGALDDVLRGDIEGAVAKCNREWASLPGSPYGQPTVALGDFAMAYAVAKAEELGHEPQPIMVKKDPDPDEVLAHAKRLGYVSPNGPQGLLTLEPEPTKEALPKVGWMDALRVGQVVLDPAKLKNRGVLVMLITTAIAAIAQFGGKYVDLSWLDKDTVTQIAGALAALVMLYVNYASSDKVGILPAKPEVPADGGTDRNTEDTMRAGG